MKMKMMSVRVIVDDHANQDVNRHELSLKYSNALDLSF